MRAPGEAGSEREQERRASDRCDRRDPLPALPSPDSARPADDPRGEEQDAENLGAVLPVPDLAQIPIN